MIIEKFKKFLESLKGKSELNSTKDNKVINKNDNLQDSTIVHKITTPLVFDKSNEVLELDEVVTFSLVDQINDESIINKENRLNEKAMYEGEVELNFIFADNSAVGINSKKVTVPFEQTIDGIPENCRMDTTIEVNSQEFLNQSGVVSTNLDLNFETDSYRTASIPVINDITTEEIEELEDYSVIIYVVKAGDTLWKIAKRFGSTVDDIVRVNGIERPDKLNVGEKIYIPQYVLKRAREPITLSVNV